MKESVTGCTHCGVCTENCEFLKKYDLTIEIQKNFPRWHITVSSVENVPKSVPRGLMDGK